MWSKTTPSRYGRTCPNCERRLHSFSYRHQDLLVFNRTSFKVNEEKVTPSSWIDAYNNKDKCTWLRYLHEAIDNDSNDDCSSGTDSAEEEVKRMNETEETALSTLHTSRTNPQQNQHV